MIRKIISIALLVLGLAMAAYGGFFRKFLVYDNLEKFDRLKNVGITIKIPGYEKTRPKVLSRNHSGFPSRML